MINFNTGNGKMQCEEQLLVRMVRDLEKTKYRFHGYAYRRTLRNILIGKEDAAIAPYFKGKAYHGIYAYLTLEAVTLKMDALVRRHLLDVIYTDHGKLYCTPEHYVA